MNGKRKRGFTLMELLVVVLIIGLLAAVALPQYNKAVVKARFTEAQANLKTLGQALENCSLSETNCELSDLAVELPGEETVLRSWGGELTQTPNFIYGVGGTPDEPNVFAAYRKEDACLCYSTETHKIVLSDMNVCWNNMFSEDEEIPESSFSYNTLLGIDYGSCDCC